MHVLAHRLALPYLSHRPPWRYGVWCGSCYGVGGWISIRLYTTMYTWHRRSSFSSLLSLLFTALKLEYIQTCCLSLHCWAPSLLPPSSVHHPSSSFPRSLTSPSLLHSFTPPSFHLSSYTSSPPIPFHLCLSAYQYHIIRRNGTRSGQTSSTLFLRLKSPVFAGWRNSST